MNVQCRNQGKVPGCRGGFDSSDPDDQFGDGLCEPCTARHKKIAVRVQEQIDKRGPRKTIPRPIPNIGLPGDRGWINVRSLGL